MATAPVNASAMQAEGRGTGPGTERTRFIPKHKKGDYSNEYEKNAGRGTGGDDGGIPDGGVRREPGSLV